MEIILLERVENLGQMGDVVKVRDGFARNFLLPQKKALRSNEANRKVFETQRVDLEARNIERRSDAESVALKMNGRSFIVIRQASEVGLLYGSVSTRDIAETASSDGAHITRNQVRLDKPLKSLGIFKVRIALHPEVDSTIEINIARSLEEAERQVRGENVLAHDDKFADANSENAGGDEKAAEFFDEDDESTDTTSESSAASDKNDA